MGQERLISDWTLFQFPTGWNSTFQAVRKILYGLVSIPNGMEFYDSS